jgi:hypothetical protein
MSFEGTSPVGSWMVTRSRGMGAAAGLGAAIVAVYTVLGALALTAPGVLSVPSFGSVVRADVGVFTAAEQQPHPPHGPPHVDAAVANVPPPATPVASAGSVSHPAPAVHAPAPRGHPAQHAAVARHARHRDRHARHRHHRRGHAHRHGHAQPHRRPWHHHRIHPNRRRLHHHGRFHTHEHRSPANWHSAHAPIGNPHRALRSGGCRRHRHVGLPRRDAPHHRRHHR